MAKKYKIIKDGERWGSEPKYLWSGYNESVAKDKLKFFSDFYKNKGITVRLEVD